MTSGKVYKQIILEMLQDIDEEKEVKFLQQVYTIILIHQQRRANSYGKNGGGNTKAR